MSPASAEVRLRAIRAHEGSQARAWEELVYQLRPPVGDGHMETRKTRAPDAGVEWYEVYADGHHEGFQAKFHASLQDALGGMRESVEAVCSKRPSLSKLTFVVPYDFTDSGSSETKTDQDRWDDAVDRWRTDFPAARGIDFHTIRAGDITAKLTLREHAGRREYWFGGLELTDQWLKERFKESVEVAGERYTPEADSVSSINFIIDAAQCGPTFIIELRSLITRARNACRQDTGMWDNSEESVSKLVSELDEILQLSFGAAGARSETRLGMSPDVARIASIASELIVLADEASENLTRFERKNLNDAISALSALQISVTNSAAKALQSRVFALIGPAGQGKTHALMRAVDRCLERGIPALAILGQRLSDKNWWPAVAETLGGLNVDADQFLQALDSMAEARGCRALIVIDALNESQSPKRWQDELPALLTQFRRYPNLALVLSYRADYRDVLGPPASLLTLRHPGFAGSEVEALAAYCQIFEISVPSKDLFEPAFSNPLFLRMYCEVIAEDPSQVLDTPSRSNLFDRFVRIVGRKATRNLGLSPASPIIQKALAQIADRILENDGNPITRSVIEQDIDGLLPSRVWPNTLFQQMVSEGLIELRPSYDGSETVAFPFQAYSEHILANRLLVSIEAELDAECSNLSPASRSTKRTEELARRIANAPWSWRSLAVMLPERENIELIDLLPAKNDDYRLQEATRESLTDRAISAFGQRALAMLRQCLENDSDADETDAETILALAPREGHPGNADWLHDQLLTLSMAERDATWSIAVFQADQDSDAYRRLTKWAERLSNAVSDEEVRLASTALMWLLTSPNRFLRDGASKTLVKLLSVRLNTAASLVQRAKDVNDQYVQERLLTCVYGAVLVGGDNDCEGARLVLEAVKDWLGHGLPVDVIARDSVRGVAAWCSDRGLLSDVALRDFGPPYKSAPPEEPPTRDELESTYGPIKDADGKYSEWRASSILSSCLDWYGDFNKYVVKSDVGYFSWYPLAGPPPSTKHKNNPLDKVDANWAGRWIANYAISLGWTTERFEAFERHHDLRRGRDSHKAERFGKKYQWIAHRELLARLADNCHPAYEAWATTQRVYEGPWVWFGRDFDPTLPPSALVNGSQVCAVAQDIDAVWAALASPAMDINMSPDDWVAMVSDLPDASEMVSSVDAAGRKWIAIQRYSTWDRDNAKRTGISKRERDVFFLQFSWLVPRGKGRALFEFIQQKGLTGRWMPDTSRTNQQYLGETGSAPIAVTADVDVDEYDIPDQLLKRGIHPRPAVEQYLWEGGTLDCSIDESIDCYAPTAELLGNTRWVGYRTEWADDKRIVVRAVEYPDGENGQSMLLADAEWLSSRLRDLEVDLVIGTLSERHALRLGDDRIGKMAFSDVSYVTLISHESATSQEVGPILKVRRPENENSTTAESKDGNATDELFDPTSI